MPFKTTPLQKKPIFSYQTSLYFGLDHNPVYPNQTEKGNKKCLIINKITEKARELHEIKNV